MSWEHWSTDSYSNFAQFIASFSINSSETDCMRSSCKLTRYLELRAIASRQLSLILVQSLRLRFTNWVVSKMEARISVEILRHYLRCRFFSWASLRIDKLVRFAAFEQPFRFKSISRGRASTVWEIAWSDSIGQNYSESLRKVCYKESKGNFSSNSSVI